jgi:hypothetical protein
MATTTKKRRPPTALDHLKRAEQLTSRPARDEAAAKRNLLKAIKHQVAAADALLAAAGRKRSRSARRK